VGPSRLSSREDLELADYAHTRDDAFIPFQGGDIESEVEEETTVISRGPRRRPTSRDFKLKLLQLYIQYRPKQGWFWPTICAKLEEW
jgi:hypothetical protein